MPLQPFPETLNGGIFFLLIEITFTSFAGKRVVHGAAHAVMPEVELYKLFNIQFYCCYS